MSTIKLPSKDQDEQLKPDAAVPARRPYGLAVEIVVILAIKICLLFVIWWLFFSAPQAHRMQMPAERVQQRLIEAPATGARSAPQSLKPGNHDHATR